MSIPLIDSLTHPSAAGSWMDCPAGAGFPELITDMRASNIAAACAVGMWGQDGYEHESFIAACRTHRELIPVAGFKPGSTAPIDAGLDHIRDLGFTGIKLHPRYSRIDIGSPVLGEVFRAARDRGLVIFYCTYMHCAIGQWPDVDPFLALVRALKTAPGARVVLLHGGDVELLRYMQLVRFNEDLLLDLSHTFLKYPDSSIDLDIRFLFHHFDRRICVGTDWPQFSCASLRARFDEFTRSLDDEKARNIASRNLLQFLRLGSTFDCA